MRWILCSTLCRKATVCARFECVGGSPGISRCTRLWPIVYVGRVSVCARFAAVAFGPLPTDVMFASLDHSWTVV